MVTRPYGPAKPTTFFPESFRTTIGALDNPTPAAPQGGCEVTYKRDPLPGATENNKLDAVERPSDVKLIIYPLPCVSIKRLLNSAA
jgi:hypothetical protein